MLNIKLTEYGVDDTLKDIRENLESALGKQTSKRRKDEMIYRALGAVDALWNMISITEISDNTKEENNDSVCSN